MMFDSKRLFLYLARVRESETSQHNRCDWGHVLVDSNKRGEGGGFGNQNTKI